MCALMGNLERAKSPGNVILEEGEGGITKASVVNVTQIFTVDKSSLVDYCGTLSPRKIEQIISGITLLIEPTEVDY